MAIHPSELKEALRAPDNAPPLDALCGAVDRRLSGTLPMSGLQAHKYSRLPPLFPLDRQWARPGEHFRRLTNADRIARASRTPEDFIRGLAFYALTGDENGGLGSYISAAWRGFDFKAEGVDALPILIAAADYHAVDILAYTYFNRN